MQAFHGAHFALCLSWLGCWAERTDWSAQQLLCQAVADVIMKMIQPNCRVQFAAEDIDFILSVLGGRLGTAECLVKLLADEESRDLILDDEALFHALLERRMKQRFIIQNQIPRFLIRQQLDQTFGRPEPAAEHR